LERKYSFAAEIVRISASFFNASVTVRFVVTKYAVIINEPFSNGNAFYRFWSKTTYADNYFTWSRRTVNYEFVTIGGAATAAVLVSRGRAIENIRCGTDHAITAERDVGGILVSNIH